MDNAKTTTTLNVYQKLAQARLMFLQRNVKKTGKNMKLEFMYYELEDIVPHAIEIFAEIGLLGVPSFNATTASMTVFNTDNMSEDGIEFTLPYEKAEKIISNTGKEVTNSLQALGSSITYMRRYLYMLALDIAEHDDVDPMLESEPVEAPKSEPKTPATPAERKAAKDKLTAADSNGASEEQITKLKSLCKTIREKDEKQDNFIQTIAMRTKGFTAITASACDALINNLSQIVEQYEGG